MKADYLEFSNPKLVSIYNTVNAINGYKDFYISLAKKLSAKKIIDIGCGTGLLTLELSKNGYEMIGIEPSGDMIDVARKSDYEKKVQWITGDALDLINYGADLAIMTGHVAQFYLDDTYWNNALASIYKSLRPGGYLAFESRNPNLKPWFKKWPSNKENAVTYEDPVEGVIKWWYEPIEIKGNRILYKNRYFITKTNENLTSVNELIFRSKDEIEKSLIQSGFIIETIYGDWNWIEANEKSPELIFVARKV